MSSDRDSVDHTVFPNFSESMTEVFYGDGWALPNGLALGDRELAPVRVLAAVQIWDGVVSGLAWADRRIVGFTLASIASAPDERTFVARGLVSPEVEQLSLRISQLDGWVYVADPTVLRFGPVLRWFRLCARDGNRR